MAVAQNNPLQKLLEKFKSAQQDTSGVTSAGHITGQPPEKTDLGQRGVKNALLRSRPVSCNYCGTQMRKSYLYVLRCTHFMVYTAS